MLFRSAGKEIETVETTIVETAAGTEGADDPLKATQVAFGGRDLGQEFGNLSAGGRFAFDDGPSPTGQDLRSVLGGLRTTEPSADAQARHEAYLKGLSPELKEALAQPAPPGGVQFQGQRYATPFAAALARQDAASALIAPDLNQAQAAAREDEIGRASCRERV